MLARGLFLDTRSLRLMDIGPKLYKAACCLSGHARILSELAIDNRIVSDNMENVNNQFKETRRPCCSQAIPPAGPPLHNMKAFKLTALAALLSLAACDDDASVASRNLSKAADMFEIDRRVVFYNGITGEYLLSLEGRCSINDQGRQLEVTCKTGMDAFKKHFLGLSDNVTYFAEQLAARDVSVYRYRVIFKPQAIVPDIDARGDVDELVSGGE